MSKNTIDMKKILLFVSIILCFSAIVSGCKNRTREIEMNKHEYTAHQTEIPMDTAKPHGRDIIADWSGESIESMYEVHGRGRKGDDEELQYMRSKLHSCYIEYDGHFGVVKQFRSFYNSVNEILYHYIKARFDELESASLLNKKAMEPYEFELFDCVLDKEELEFARDTFRINETCRMMMDIPSSEKIDWDLAISYLYKFYAEEYLIYKYYTKAMGYLADEDKVLLEISQKKWNDSLQADWNLEGETLIKYMGGGRIWHYATFTNKRARAEFLFKMYNHVRMGLPER